MIVLTSQSAGDPRVGGKGRGLSRLLARGANVPPTACLPPDGDLESFLPSVRDWLGGRLAAVRSSAAQEDGAERSHAGQYESVLRVPAEGLREAIQRCRASGRSERVRAYAGAEQLVSVLVQPMLEPEVAGVLFTCDPVSGSRNHVRIDAVAGSAEDLLAGRVAGMSACVTREGEPVWGGLQGVDAGWLARQAVALEEDVPLDLEWAVCGGELFWLQARPVTGSPRQAFTLPAGALPPVAPGETHWTSLNAREALPGVASPLLEDLFPRLLQLGFEESARQLGVKLEGELLAFFEGRPFLNVTALRQVVRQLPLANPDVLIEALLGLPAGKPQPRLPSPVLLARMLWRVVRLPWDYRAVVERELARDKSLSLESQLDIRELFSLHALGSGLYTKFYRALEDGFGVSPGAFLQGLGSLRFGSSGAALRHLVQHPEDLPAFLEEYGHLGSGTIDPSAPVWADAPERVLELVEALRDRGETQGRAAYLAELSRRRREAVAQAAARLGWPRRLIFRLLVRALQWAAPYRENLKFYAHRRLAMVRARLVERYGPDVFLLRYDELECWPAPALIEARRAERQRWERLACPLHRVEDRLYFAEWTSGDRFTGIPGSPGIARGPARVLLSLDEAGRLRPGEVLVTLSTDPSWTPLFSLAGAVVVEVGSALSHGAVVAREVGVPAVLGVPGIVRSVRDGEMLEVDGGRGEVRRQVGADRPG